MVIAEVVAARLGLDEDETEVVRMGAALHDIGKVAVSQDVLAKAGHLSEDELAEVRRHPTAGARMVQLVRPLRRAVPAVLHHHERWDGCGYPEGLAGAEIPVEARILAVADTFDAMTSDQARSSIRRWWPSSSRPGTTGSSGRPAAFARPPRRGGSQSRDSRASATASSAFSARPCCHASAEAASSSCSRALVSAFSRL